MRVYAIDSGKLYDDTPAGLRLLAAGHSGFESAMDDPGRVGEKGVGPLPPGAYVIGDPYDHPTLGPVTMNLTPVDGDEMHDRGSLRIHGMSKLGAAESSHGCMLFMLGDRHAIAAGSRQLVVVSSLRVATDPMA